LYFKYKVITVTVFKLLYLLMLATDTAASVPRGTLDTNQCISRYAKREVNPIPAIGQVHGRLQWRHGNRSFMISANESSLVRDFEASSPEAARRLEASNDIIPSCIQDDLSQSAQRSRRVE